MEKKKKRERRFDLERWLRDTINGCVGLAYISEKNAVMAYAGHCLGVLGDGGRIIGKTGTDSIARWAPYPGVSFETVTHHLLKQALIVHIMLKIEEDHENPRGLRAEKILLCALTHDLSEIVGTDINYHEKNKSAATRAWHKTRDRVAHDSVVAGLRPQWRAYFPAPPDVNGEYPEKERLFWESSELAGYCLFMLEEVRLGNLRDEHTTAFHDDVKKLMARLEERAADFVSARELLDTEILPKWRELEPKAESARKRLKKFKNK